jgi:hypothetical protein
VSGLGEWLGFLFTTGRIAKGFFGHREILSRGMARIMVIPI